MHDRGIYRTFAAFLTVAVVAGAAGACSIQSGSAGGPADQAASGQQAAAHDALEASDDEAAARPLERLLRASLEELSLRPDQRSAIEAIGTDLENETRPVRAARQDLAATLADQVAAGRIDDAAIAQKQAAVVQAVRDAKPAMQDALNRLHGALDAAQRRALVDKIRDKGEALRDRMDERGGARGVLRSRFMRLADQLELTAAQRMTIRDGLRDEFQRDRGAFDESRRAQARARMREVGQAFVSDSFDARALDVGRDAPDLAQKISSAVVRVVKVVEPVLTAEQRAKAASIIRTRAAAGR
jgi:Spy/CpxP family protein refolding chaperone